MSIKGSAALGALACAVLLASGVLAYPTVYPTGVTINEPGVSEGYYFVPNGTVWHLLEPDGTVVHSWYPPCGWTYLTRPLDDGHILVKSCDAPGSYAVMELDWDSNTVWQFSQPPAGYPEDTNFHHDWVRLDNGNTLILTRNVTVYPEISSKSIVDDFILEVTPGGEVVWEWHTGDHFDEFGFSQERKDYIAYYAGDWSHANAIAPIPDNTYHSDPRFLPGNIIVSFRYQGIAVIDRATDQIVWFEEDATVGQHDAHMIPGDLPGGGNILAFDNGYAAHWTRTYNRDYSRVVEIDPLTRSVVYEYNAEASGRPKWSFYASFVSGAQRLPGGNTLICEGASGRVFEITPSGAIVWEYIHPWINPRDNNSNTLYRAYKVSLDWAAPYFEPDLVVSGFGDSDPVAGGEDLTYTIQVENSGSDPAVDAQLSGTTPAGTTFLSISAPQDWICTVPPVGGTGSIHCTTRSFSAGESALFALGVNVDPCVAEFIDHTVTVSSAGSDASPADNATVISTAVSETSCADGNLCTVDSCDQIAQLCVFEPLVCTPIDSCHDAGACDPGTGICSSPVLPDGTDCDDGDPATCADICGAGSCAGTFVAEPEQVNASVRLSFAEGTTTITWNDAPGEFNVYRGSILWDAPFDYNHACLNTEGPLSVMSATDGEIPSPQDAHYYLVTRVDQCRDSSSGTDSEGTVRTDPYRCPNAEDGP